MLALAFVGLAALDAGCLGYSRRGLDYYIVEATGARPRNCGRFRFDSMQSHQLTPDQRASVAACVARARRDHEAFVYSLEGPGIDSYIGHGVLGRAGHRPQLFWYDSAPCGGSHCSERFEVAKCGASSANRESDETIGCE